jgi:thiosulfate/3-mercaptopyruvate sulfurtransferase
MNKKNTLSFFVSAAIAITAVGCSQQSIPVGYEQSAAVAANSSLVSTDWLYSNLNTNTVIDVRSPAEYAAGHITGSINIPFDVVSVWATSDFNPGGLWVQLPAISALTTALGEYGITSNSSVVLVTGLPVANPYALGSPGRVALTLAYAGVKNVAVLNGAFEKWASEGKPVSTQTTAVTAVNFGYKDAGDMFVDINYVKNKLGKVVLVDARDFAVYAGDITEPWALKAGHIPTAVSLPAASLWNVADGTMKSYSELELIAGAVIGDGKNHDIVVYCGVGGYAGTVWFTLAKILGYKNVKVFDGSSQEWSMTYDMVK